MGLNVHQSYNDLIRPNSLHLGLDLVVKISQLIHIRLLRRPFDA